MVNSSPFIEVYCTRPSCNHPRNFIDPGILTSNFIEKQFCCNYCIMPLILEKRFIPIDLIGQGGFGRTFLARDLNSANELQQVVIKQLCPQIPSGQSHLTPPVLKRIKKLFYNEGEVLRALNHSQIPQVYASFVVEALAGPPSSTMSNGQQQFFYLVQEYIEGKNLLQELQQNGQFSGKETVEFLQQMLSVLTYIHNEGVIHRDIKLSNIMRRSNDRKLFLIDFGAVKQVLLSVLPVEQSTFVPISYFYASPEQSASRPISYSSDLYSLAACCVYLLTGSCEEDLRNGDTWNWQEKARVNDKLVGVLDRMLSVAPEDRYQSAQEVLVDLSGLEQPQQQPPPPPPPPPPLRLIIQRLMRFVKQQRRVVLPLLFVLGLAIIVFLKGVFFPHPPELPATYFSRGEEPLIKIVSTSPECQQAFKFKEDGTSAFAKKEFKKAEELFNKSINQFKIAFKTSPDNNKCEVDPETQIYLNNSKAAQVATGAGNLLTIAVVIPSASGVPEDRGAALEMLRGVAQVQNVQIEGRPLQILIVKENSNKLDEVKKVAWHLSENNIPGDETFRGEILGVIGHYGSTNTKEAGDVYKNKGLVLISPTSTAVRKSSSSPNGLSLNNYVFRTASDDSIAAGKLVEHMWDRLKLRKALIVFDSDNKYSNSLKSEFANKLISRGANPQDIIDCDLYELTINQCIARVQLSTQVLMLAPSLEKIDKAELVAQQIFQRSDTRLKLLGGDIMYRLNTLRIGKAVEGMVVAVPSHVSRATETFRKKAIELWGTTNVSWITLTSYDAAQAILTALTELVKQNDEPTRPDLYNKLNNISTQGATEKVKFENGERKNIGFLVEVKRSSFQVHSPVSQFQFKFSPLEISQ